LMRQRPLNIVRMLGPKVLDHLRGGCILILTTYEVGNALWKEATSIKRITLDGALTLLELLEEVYEAMSIVSPSNARLVLEFAHGLGVAYYDSAYIVAAYVLEAVLVTGDEKPWRRATARKDSLVQILGRGVELYPSSKLAGQPGRQH